MPNVVAHSQSLPSASANHWHFPSSSTACLPLLVTLKLMVAVPEMMGNQPGLVDVRCTVCRYLDLFLKLHEDQIAKDYELV